VRDRQSIGLIRTRTARSGDPFDCHPAHHPAAAIDFWRSRAVGRTEVAGRIVSAVELSRVTFVRGSGPPVLENVSLRIAQASMSPLSAVGSGNPRCSGCCWASKSRSPAPCPHGKAIDTLDISAVRPSARRRPANGKLATGSIYDNICGGVQLPLEYAWEAARLAGSTTISRRCDGHEHGVRRGGQYAVGRQRQRS